MEAVDDVATGERQRVAADFAVKLGRRSLRAPTGRTNVRQSEARLRRSGLR
jgi:hypothetical protein